MKKWMCTALAGMLALTLAFTGCSQRDNNNDRNNTPGSSQNQNQNGRDNNGTTNNNNNNNTPGNTNPNNQNNGTNPGNVTDDNGNLVDDIKDGMDKLGDDLENGANRLADEIQDNMPGTDNNARSRNGGILQNEQNMPSVSKLLTDSALVASSTVPGQGTLGDLDNTKQGWGQGYQVNEQNQPESCVLYQQKYGQYGTYFLAPSEKVIYLTFDEGYENGYTEKILDVLKEKQVSGVFFVTMPYVKSQPELVRRMIDEGHIVGNHSVNHPSFPSKDVAVCEKEIMELHQYMLDEFGYEMNLFRFPMGEYSERTLALTQSLGYHSIFWSFAYKDWDPENQPDPAAALERVTSAVHPGAIYLLHAVSKTNTEILGQAIDTFRAQGYTIGKFDLSAPAEPVPEEAPAGESAPAEEDTGKLHLKKS